jgi:RNA polymerase primary sigma factor
MERSSIKKEIIQYLKIINFFKKKFDINSYISNSSINNDEELLQMYEDVKKEANNILIMKSKDSFKYLINSISSLIRKENVNDKDKLSTINNIMDKLSRIKEINGNPYEVLFRNIYIKPFLINSFYDDKKQFFKDYPSLLGFVKIYEKNVAEKENSPYEIKDENLKYHQKNQELLDRYYAGDEDAKRQLVIENMKLIQKIANSYYAKNKSYPLEELINEGVTGLLTAVERFNPKIGKNFSLYAAFWIKQKIASFLRGNFRIIDLPANMISFIMDTKTKLSKIEAEYGPNLSSEKKAELLGITLEDYYDYLMYADEEFSLDAKLPATRRTEETDINTDQLIAANTNVEKEVIEKVSEETLLKKLKEELTEKEFVIIYKRFGFGDSNIKNLETIAKELRVSPQNIYQTLKTALIKVRHILEGNDKELEKLRLKQKVKKRRKALPKIDGLFPNLNK